MLTPLVYASSKLIRRIRHALCMDSNQMSGTDYPSAQAFFAHELCSS